MMQRWIIELVVTTLVLVVFGAILLSSDRAGGDQERITSHDEAACNRCHAMVADIGGDVTERNLSGECLKCHQLKAVEYDGRRLAFHESASPRCQSCHSFHTPNAIQASSRTIKSESRSVEYLAHCLSCHQVGTKTAELSIGHREAVSFYHSSTQALAMLTPSEGCLVCHSNRGSRHGDFQSSEDVPRFDQMATHPYGIRFRGFIEKKDSLGHNLDSFRPLLINDRIECQTCHSLTNQTENYLAGGGEYGELCQACHSK